MHTLAGNQRVVVDWDGKPVGWVRDEVVNPRTRTTRSLLVNLRPEARARLNATELTLSIPSSQVAALRRDEVALKVKLGQLALPGSE